MNPSAKDFITDKIKLIYEFNHNSPLFARVAAMEVNRGNFLEAIKVLEEGLTVHPLYPTAYFILSLAKAYAGKETEALEHANKGSELLGSHESLEWYSNKISEIISERNSLTGTKRPAFLGEQKRSGRQTQVFEEKLDDLAEKLSKAKISAKVDPDSPTPSLTEFSGKIVSETMAEIFLSQKNYSEAISMYNELMILRPEKMELYESKIEEIKMMMNGK
ncbi:MAG: hypothetical protein AB1775_04960 [Bacteroidota bacterium]